MGIEQDLAWASANPEYVTNKPRPSAAARARPPLTRPQSQTLALVLALALALTLPPALIHYPYPRSNP